MDGDTIALLVILLVPIALAVGAALVVRDTVRRRGNWGINLKTVRCPRCGEPAPAARSPKNMRQALWGGCTCARCGAEYDKWGQEAAGTVGLGRRE